jgi:hypothetical protein
MAHESFIGTFGQFGSEVGFGCFPLCFKEIVSLYQESLEEMI